MPGLWFRAGRRLNGRHRLLVIFSGAVFSDVIDEKTGKCMSKPLDDLKEALNPMGKYKLVENQ